MLHQVLKGNVHGVLGLLCLVTLHVTQIPSVKFKLFLMADVVGHQQHANVGQHCARGMVGYTKLMLLLITT